LLLRIVLRRRGRRKLARPSYLYIAINRINLTVNQLHMIIACRALVWGIHRRATPAMCGLVRGRAALCISRRVAVQGLVRSSKAKARPTEALVDPSYQKHSRVLSDPSGCRGRRIRSLNTLVCDTPLVHVCRNSSRTARWSGDGEDAHDAEIVDQRAADLLESDRTKRPAHLLLWNRTAVAEPCLIRTQRKLLAGGGYQRSQRPARQLIGGPRLAINRRYAVRNRTAASGAGAPLMTTCEKAA
jgi:hypothetical protein